MLPDDKLKILHSAWPYATGRPHLGNVSGALLPADILRRWYLQNNYRVVWLFGSDQYGTPILLKSKKDGIPPAKIAKDGYLALLDVLKNLDMAPTSVGKTTSPQHTKFISNVINTGYARGFIKKSTCVEYWCCKCKMSLTNRTLGGKCSKCLNPVGQDYCQICNKYCGTKDVVGHHCKICNNNNIEVKSRPGLSLVLVENKDLNIAKIAKNYMGAWAADMRPLEISRNMEWGVKCPIVGGVVYVWMQALCGYRELVEKYPQFKDVKPQYFIGKDNFFHHAIVLNSITQQMGWPAAARIYVRNFLMLTSGKISKKNGNTIYDLDLLNLSGNTDSVRLYLATIDPLDDETRCSVENYLAFHNGVYCKNIANLYNRYAGIIDDGLRVKYLEPKIPREIYPGDSFWAQLMEDSKIQNIAKICINYAKHLNRQIVLNRLWQATTKKIKINELSCHIIKFAKLIAPICPKIAKKIMEDHGLPGKKLGDEELYINAKPYKYKKIKL